MSKFVLVVLSFVLVAFGAHFGVHSLADPFLP